MHPSWADRLMFLGLMVALAVTAFFSFRYMIRFRRQVKLNREMGMYDDPEFKRQIRPLNVLRYGLVGGELLGVVALILALEFGLPPQTMFRIAVIFVMAISIPLYVVDRRWRRLMTKGME